MRDHECALQPRICTLMVTHGHARMVMHHWSVVHVFVGCGCWLLTSSMSVTLEAVRVKAMAMLEQAASLAASWAQIEEVKLLGCRHALLRLPQRCKINRSCFPFRNVCRSDLARVS